MERKREVYCLKDVPEEVIAVAFAKTSRSPELIRDITKELTEEGSSKFHEKWVVGYGHSSVAEHAVVHIALDNVTRLAVENIESNRLASYTEKSTRYQVYDRSCYYIPEKFEKAGLKELYVNACNLLIDTYQEALPKVKEIVKEIYPIREDEAEKAYEGRILSKYIDVCRFLLPYSVLANMGMTANARTMEHAISKMLSSPVEEIRQIGEEVKEAALGATPTLLRYADESAYLLKVREKLRNVAEQLNVPISRTDDECVELVDCEDDAENKFIAGCLYEHLSSSYNDIYKIVQAMNETQKMDIIDKVLAPLGEHDKPIRALELPYVAFDCIMDQGAWFDLKRNRMMTQLHQKLTPEYGYAIPKLIEESGMKQKYCDAIDNASKVYYEIAKVFPDEAAYILTNAHNRRMFMKMNLRELFYLVKIRSRNTGHFSYRRIVLRMYELACEKYPVIMKYLHLRDLDDSENVGKNNFASY